MIPPANSAAAMPSNSGDNICCQHMERAVQLPLDRDF